MYTTSPKTLSYNGITDTINGWSRRIGISDTTIRRRLDSGSSTEEALSPISKHKSRARTYNYNGEELTVKELAEKLNISVYALYGRLEKYTIEQSMR